MNATDYAHTDAALCIWEHALITDLPVSQWLADGESARTGRDNAINLAPFAEHAWKRARDLGLKIAFDREFVPAFMAYIVDGFDFTSDVTLDAAYHIGESIYLDTDS